MRLARFSASTTLLQGLLPLLVFGGWRPGGLFLVSTAAVYVLLSWGLWTGRRWALPLGLALTLPQLLIVSSWLVSWQFFVGTSVGLGAKPGFDVLRMPLNFFWHVGNSYFAACFGYNPGFAASVASGPPTTYVGVNVVATFVLFLLVRSWRAMHNHTLQRTETGVPVLPEQHA